MNSQIEGSSHHDLEAHERHLAALRHTLTEQQQSFDTLADALREHERAIHRLQGRIDEQNQLLVDARDQIERQQSTILPVEATDVRQTAEYKLALALTLANSAYDALLVVDEQTNIIAINDAAETLFGVQRPIGSRLIDITKSPELEMMVEDSLANAEETLEEQHSFDTRTYKTRVQVIRRDNNLFIGIALQDISALVRLNRARRDMVANISHELRTPIANIRLIIDSLFHEQDKPKRKQSTSALKAIARETDSLLWLVQELLDLSMIETGQAILRMVEFRLKQLTDEVVERIADQLEAKDLKVLVEVAEDFEVLADYDQLRRVLVNLIHNAIKWSPPGATITVITQYVGDEAEIVVTDTGPGVPDDQTERIFERFYQVDPSRSSGEGTGLGLAICKHIIEAHSGRIWAEGNSLQPGGRFHITVMRGENEPFDDSAAPIPDDLIL